MSELNWIKCIGGGAYAQVWEAEDDLGRRVAVKLIDPSVEQISSALNHARALAKAKHRNVVDVHYVTEVDHPNTSDKVSAIVMELLHGSRLDNLLKVKKLTSEKVRQIGFQLIDGLEHIHQSDLTHGDLHAGNIIVDEDNIKIIDILYLDTFHLLSTMSRNMRIERDCLQLKMLLADLLEHSELDFGEVHTFNTAVSEILTLNDIREAFENVTDPDTTGNSDRRLEFAFKRFKDPCFVATQSYAAALNEETPDEVVFPLMNLIVETDTAKEEHANYLAFLWDRLSVVQQDTILKNAAMKLDENLPDGDWYPHIVLLDSLGSDVWLRLPEVQRLRIEAIITQDILTGRYDIYAPFNLSGVLGTWALDCGEYFNDQKTLIDNICTMLHRDWYTQNYIGKHLMPLIPRLRNSPTSRTLLIEALQSAICNDAKIVKQNLLLLPGPWREELK